MNDLKNALGAWRRGVFVLSMCSEKEGVHPEDNLYMWGHYGNGHRGIAIEFDTQLLASDVVKENQRVKGTPVGTDQVWAEIQYKTQLPPLNRQMFFDFFKTTYEEAKTKKRKFSRTGLDDYYELMGTIKSTAWEKENEWRLMWHNDETKSAQIYKCTISDAAIRVVYLGLNMSDKAKSEIIQAVKNNFSHAKIHQAGKRLGDLSLNFQPIKS